MKNQEIGIRGKEVVVIGIVAVEVVVIGTNLQIMLVIPLPHFRIPGVTACDKIKTYLNFSIILIFH